MPRELWIAFPDRKSFNEASEGLKALIAESEGRDMVYVYLRDTKQFRKMTSSEGIRISPEMKSAFEKVYGEKNVTVRGAR